MTKQRHSNPKTPIEACLARISDVKSSRIGNQERIEIAQDLAGLILESAKNVQTKSEKKREKYLAKLIQDPQSKALVAIILDTCFRTNDAKSLVNELQFLLSHHNTLSFLPFWQKLALKLTFAVGSFYPALIASTIKKIIQTEVQGVIAPGEDDKLLDRLKTYKPQAVKINLNRLGEAILGRNEAERRLEQNVRDLKNPNIEVISVKISSICNNIHLVAYNDTLDRLKVSLRRLYREALANKKFINLDMEEYKDLHLTVRLFQEVLSEPEFLHLSAGIALQSYIPDSYLMQVQLTEWATHRCKNGGSPIKIRIVKGANLGMERVEASIKEWPQSCYKQKEQVDANFKKMLHYGIVHAKTVHIGIGSHNLFDIAYGIILASEYAVEKYVTIEMLAGMAPHITRVLPKIWRHVLLYLPCAKKEELHNAIAYLMRRLDENTSPQNFLTHIFDLTSTSRAWDEQKYFFAESVIESDAVSTIPRRQQNRKIPQLKSDTAGHFTNEPDTDFSLPNNQAYAELILQEWQVQYHEVSLVIGGHNLVSSEICQGVDPSRPGCKIYTYFLAQEYQANVALEFAKNQAPIWANIPLNERIYCLQKVANILRANRKKFIGAMMQEVGKSIPEADSELSEAIDFVDYYIKELNAHTHADTLFSAGQAALVLTPWNFPVSIATSALVSCLAAGNSVIFKPAPEAILCGWLLAECFWQAGIPKEVLQFIVCHDDPIGTMLVTDPRVDFVVLTGATATARRFLQMRPTLKLYAETGGKNSMIVTKFADRDLAIKDIVQSAFGYAGQKCSALSLLILDEEVYQSSDFRRQLIDASESLICGSSYNPASIITPLIRPASEHLLRALTTLEHGESWLVEPKQDKKNPQIWSCGIKLGVKPGSFMHQTELFGPVLGVMCAKDLEQAIEFANSTPYGLTAGIHSLDTREHAYWKQQIMAGNCYINRPITGAIVARQPFGGCKASSFGVGMKVGGPNYLLQLANCTKASIHGQHAISSDIMDLEGALLQLGVKNKESTKFYKAASSYAFWWDNYFAKPRILRRLVGQDNILEYRARPEIFVLLQDKDSMLDIMLILAAAKTAGCKVICGATFKLHRRLFRQGPLEQIFKKFGWTHLTLKEATHQISKQQTAHIRALHPLPHDITDELSQSITCLDMGPPSHNGRLELIRYVREVATSYDYHRYGSLMGRESEMREPTL